MELIGKIQQILETRRGTSERGDWQITSYLMETIEYTPRKVMFEVRGKDRIDRLNIQPGQKLRVYISIDAREWKDKWYNTVTCYDARPYDTAEQKPDQVDMPQPTAGNEDLAF